MTAPLPTADTPDTSPAEAARVPRAARAKSVLEAFKELEGTIAGLRRGASKVNDEICQTLGRVLDYPRFADDQKNFLGAVDADGVCVGDHVAETLAMEAARKIADLRRQLADAERAGMEKAADIADGVWNNDYGTAAMAAELIRAAMPAAAKDEVRHG